MQNLEKRITKLEQASPSGETVMFIHFVAPGDKDAEIQRIENSRQYWTRDAGESEKEFKDRAKREATPNPYLIFLCDSVERAASVGGVATDNAVLPVRKFGLSPDVRSVVYGTPLDAEL